MNQNRVSGIECHIGSHPNITSQLDHLRWSYGARLTVKPAVVHVAPFQSVPIVLREDPKATASVVVRRGESKSGVLR